MSGAVPIMGVGQSGHEVGYLCTENDRREKYSLVETMGIWRLCEKRDEAWKAVIAEFQHEMHARLMLHYLRELEKLNAQP